MARLVDPYAAKAIVPGQLGGIGGSPGWPRCSIPFVIECPVTATATTETILAAGAFDSDIRVIAAWATMTTNAAADEDWDVRTAGGAAGGTLIVSLQMNSLSAANGIQFISAAGAATNDPSSLADRVVVDLDGADGIFIDKVSGNDGAGTVYLLCIRV